jgi:hypothetical protein
MILGILLLCPVQSAAGETCWRGRPAPECDSFWVTEYGISRRLSGVSFEPREEELSSIGIRYEIGHMFNVADRYALGGTVTVMGTGETFCGLHGRFRYWLSGNWSLDLSPGVTFYGKPGDDDYDLLYPSLSGRFVLNYADFIGVSLGLEHIRVRHEGSQLDWYLGAHAGSYPGATLGLIFAILAIVAVSSYGVTGMH